MEEEGVGQNSSTALSEDCGAADCQCLPAASAGAWSVCLSRWPGVLRKTQFSVGIVSFAKPDVKLIHCVAGQKA